MQGVEDGHEIIALVRNLGKVLAEATSKRASKQSCSAASSQARSMKGGEVKAEGLVISEMP